MAKFEFATVNGEAPKDLSEVVFQSLGAASVCWTKPPVGVFESERAEEIGKAVIEWIETNYRPEAPQVDWPDSEPEIGWEQLARNWQNSALYYSRDVAYWRERAGAAEGKLDRIKTLTERDNG